MRPQWEVADVLHLVAEQLKEDPSLPQVVKKTITDILQCRTSALGGHLLECPNCKHTVISYNSCRNRHCPKCQYSKREQWLLDRSVDVLPVRYFHVVFTLPHLLNPVAKAFPRVVYHALFHAAWMTIQTLSMDPKWLGARSAMIALLHTWGQNLSFHPHLHCIIPQGGFVPQLNRWVYAYHRKMLFPVRVISALYRRFFLDLLQQAFSNKQILWSLTDWNTLMQKAQSKSFNVFAKLPFTGPHKVLEYISRYSHRVAITNQRLIHVSKESVQFSYRDYRDGNSKSMSLAPMEFARRFLQHVLPKGFAKIRHYGFLSNKAKEVYMPAILAFFERRRPAKIRFDLIEHFINIFNTDLSICPHCHKSKLLPIAHLPPARGDPSCIISRHLLNNISIPIDF